MKAERAKIFVIFMTVAGLAVLGATLAFLTLPSLSEANDLAGQLSDAETEVQAQYANRKQLGDTLNHVAEAKKEVAGLAAQFVPQGSELDFITAIEALGTLDGVETHLQLAGGGDIADAKEFDRGFALTINGPYRNAIKAVVDLERMPQIVVIESFGIQGGGIIGDPSDPSQITLNGVFASPPPMKL